MIHWFYERKLLKDIIQVPENICFMLTGQDVVGAPEKLNSVVVWCRDLGISQVIFHIDTSNPDAILPCLPKIKEIGSIAQLTIYMDNIKEVIGKGIAVTVVVGVSGREEITRAIRKMAEDGVDPAKVNEDLIESYLTFHCEPDFVIKTGGDHLTDFLIWQGVYSELFFSDVNWKQFRKVDFLRAIRDYQVRKRRFGK